MRARVPAAVIVLEVAPLAFLGSVAAVLAYQWPSIPERFVVHWNVLGRPDRWADRSAVGVLGPVAAGVACTLALLAWRRFAAAAGNAPGRVEGQLRRGGALGIAYALAALCGAFGARPLLATTGPWALAVGACMGFLFAPFVFVAAGAGREWRGALARAARTPPGPKVAAALASRRRPWATALLAALAGAALVLFRIP